MAGADDTLTLFLAGDVMTGRGIDQLFATASSPELHESYVRDARDYVALAEKVGGPIARPLPPEAIWGEALPELDRARPDARIVNLETSVTTSDDFWPGKEIHYRMHPANVGCLTAARLDACTLANNHVLDFGHRGLLETLEQLERAGVKACGAGRTRAEAEAPVRVGRVLLAAAGTESSGVFPEWAATDARAGVAYVPELSDAEADRISARLGRERRTGDVAVLSIHWGSNWGDEIPHEQRRFAHRLLDSGAVDAVFGHSSHHPRAVEVYRGRLVLYGAGDFINDYEGIGGYEEFRGDLRLMYLPRFARDGRLAGLRMVPWRSRGLVLVRPPEEDTAWLAARLSAAGRAFGTTVGREADGALTLAWA